MGEALHHLPVPITLLMGSDYHLNHPPPPPSVEQLSSTKLVPGANKGWGLLILFHNVAEFQFSCLVVSDSLWPMNCSTPGFPVHHQLAELAQTHIHRVSDAIQPIHPCHPLLLPSIFPSIRVFSNESVLCIRWPKY